MEGAPMPVTQVGVYAGSGTSHSWIWFAELFDSVDSVAPVFLTESDIAAGGLVACDVLCISGGDTFAIAAGLGSGGAARIGEFVERGGTYIGTCAGAYLVLRSSVQPLDRFNFVSARITNLTKTLPAALQQPEKYCTAYGCRYVYHPVREAVLVQGHGDFGTGAGLVPAPLYGGPGMHPSDEVEVLATYADFTPGTEFLVAEDLARQTLIGMVAGARKRLGRGCLYVFGPHIEHPHYGEANRLLLQLLSGCPRSAAGSPASARETAPAFGRKDGRALLSALSNARIVALALERQPVWWRIGQKVYDPERIRVFLEAIWKRARRIDTCGAWAGVSVSIGAELTERFRRTTALLKGLSARGACQGCACAEASEVFQLLRTTAVLFLTQYFQLQQDGFLKR